MSILGSARFKGTPRTSLVNSRVQDLVSPRSCRSCKHFKSHRVFGVFIHGHLEELNGFRMSQGVAHCIMSVLGAPRKVSDGSCLFDLCKRRQESLKERRQGHNDELGRCQDVPSCTGPARPCAGVWIASWSDVCLLRSLARSWWHVSYFSRCHSKHLTTHFGSR